MYFSYNIYMDKRVLKIIKIIIVNLITSMRIVGAFILPFVYYKNGVNVAAAMMIILFLTDAVDGYLARKFNVSTFFGCILDAFSDKLLNAVAFVILSINYNFLLAPLIIEIAILYTNYSTYRYGGNVQSSKIGKIKTTILDICVILSLIVLGLPTLHLNYVIIRRIIVITDILIYAFGFIIILACIAALYDYMMKNRDARRNPKCFEIKYEEKNRKPFSLIKKQLFDTEYYKKHKNESILRQFYL